MVQVLNDRKDIWEDLQKEKQEILLENPDNLRTVSMSSLGRLLDDLIFSSKTLKECLRSFVEGGKANFEELAKFVLVQIPLVGGTLLTAMEFYGVKKLIGSSYISSDEKVEAVFRAVTKVTVTVGTAFGGFLVGQVLLPIPIVGGMVGGAVGGMIGTLFGKKIQKMKSQEPILFTSVINLLKRLRNENGSWSFETMPGVFKNMMARWLTLSKPGKFEDGELWLTVISFFAISYYITLMQMIDKKKGIEEDEREEIEQMNEWIEKSIVYLSQNISILNYEKDLAKINDVMRVLINDGYITFDIEIPKEVSGEKKTTRAS